MLKITWKIVNSRKENRVGGAGQERRTGREGAGQEISVRSDVSFITRPHTWKNTSCILLSYKACQYLM